ncbi:mucin-13-like [Notechis scutatus]|uniref:Mucin-13-like n=1 Tax=Notechis scutatus TaxID=8663 RepID=A0A6J1TXB4_9SAUR|nr:mucin-13-like [Notechis scutatus]
MLFYILLGISGCDIVLCDNDTTDCKDVEGSIPTCECKPGMAKNYLEDKACRACQGCSAEKNEFCFLKANLVPECRCLPNFEKKDAECEACSIGFSGEGCQDSYMAIIIGISTLCGVLLVALIGVTICILRKRKPKTEEQQLVSHEYSTSGNPYGVPPATNFAESGRMFPRIRATNDAPLSKATAENPTNFYKEGAANRGYVPEQDYSNDNWLDMPSRY